MFDKRVLFFVATIFLGCELKSGVNTINSEPVIESLKVDVQYLKNILGVKMDSVLLLFDELKVEKFSKEIVEYEGVEWDALNIYSNDNELYVKIESSYDEDMVNRITIFHPKIAYRYGNVGTEFLEIKNFVDSTKLNYFQDGLLGVISLQDPNLAYFLDTSGIGAEIFYGINNLYDIPLETRINEIIMFDSLPR